MKKLLLAVLVVACAMTVSMGTRAQDAPKVHSMTGCLRAGDAPGSYMLSDLEKGPKSVGIVSSDVNWRPMSATRLRLPARRFPLQTQRP